VAVHNLMEILADPGAATTPAFDPVEYSIIGATGNVHSFALSKSDGSTSVVIWREEVIWDIANAVEIPATPLSVNVLFEEAYQDIELFDPISGVSSLAQYTNTDTISLDLYDHPIILDIGPDLL